MLASMLLAVGCSDSGSGNGGPDLAVTPTGGDMSAVAQTTIAMARMGNVATEFTVTAVVIGIVGDPADAKEWYIEDPAGGAFSGIDVYCNHTAHTNPCPMSIAVPKLHDLVTVTGKLSPFHGRVELAPTAQTTVSPNATPPAAMAVSPADIAATSTNAGVRGMLVKLNGSSFAVDSVTPQPLYDTKCAGDGGAGASCSGCKPPTYGGFQVNDGAGHEILVQNSFFDSEHLASSPECLSGVAAGMQVTVGKTFTTLAGIPDVDAFAMPTGTVTLQPTSDTDYTLQ
jgi:hypothetical protein